MATEHKRENTDIALANNWRIYCFLIYTGNTGIRCTLANYLDCAKWSIKALQNQRGIRRGSEINSQHVAVLVYQITRSCWASYVGQSRWCVNICLMEHVSNVDAGCSSKLARHASECRCIPHFRRQILKKYNLQLMREIYEAYIMHKNRSTCVCTLSLTLTKKEIDYLVQ